MGRPVKAIFFGNPKGSGVGGLKVASATVGGTNTNYTATPTIVFSTPSALTGGILAVGHANMSSVSATVTTGGNGTVANDYAIGDILTISGTTGTAGVFDVATLTVGQAVNVAAGTNTWVTGNTVTLSTGFSTPAVLTITDDGAGGISSVAVTTPGVWSVGANPTDPVTPDTTTNAAAVLGGATFNLRMDVATVTLNAGGSMSVISANPASTSSSGTGTGATLTISYNVGSVTITDPGNGYAAPVTATITGNATLTPVTSSAGAIVASAFVTGGTSAIPSDIVSQEGARRYKVTNAQGTSDCSLVTAVPAAGELSITATDSAGGTYYVYKLFGRTATLIQNTGTQFANQSRVRWVLAGSGSPAVINVSVEIATA